MEEYKEEKKFGKKIIYWIIGLCFVVSGIVWFFSTGQKVVETGIIRYEEFQEIYNSCSKLNTDLCNMRSLPADDVMFEQFSKPQRINTLKTNLNRWVEDYNFKSKVWTRSMWKGGKLPYQLSVNDFNCYDNASGN